MTTTLTQAFAEKGMKARYESAPAKILPVTAELLADLPADTSDKVGQALKAGDVIVSWQPEGGKRKGRVLDPMGWNDLSIVVPMGDGTESVVGASDMVDTAVRLVDMERDDRQNRKDLVEQNERAQREHRARVERGELAEDDEFVPAKPRYADGAFAQNDGFVACMKARLAAEHDNPFSGLEGKSIAAMAEFRIGKATAHNLTAEDARMAQEAKSLRTEIAKFRAADAAPAGQKREHGLERVTDELNDLPSAGQGMTAAQVAAMMPNRELIGLAFAPLTTTPLEEIQSRRLGPRDANTVIAHLRRHEETEWGPGAIEKTRALLTSRMPGYSFEGKMFSRGGVDMMLIADQAGAVLYAWDSETRVKDFDAAPMMEQLTEADVPTEDELQALRDELKDLRYDSGAEIDFGFDDEDEDEPEYDDEDDYGIGAGPRPDGY